MKDDSSVLWRLLVSRNKLVDDFLLKLNLPDEQFDRGLKMRKDNWRQDEEIWGKKLKELEQ